MNKNYLRILLIGLLLGNDPGCRCKNNSSVQNEDASAPVSMGDSTNEKWEEKKPHPFIPPIVSNKNITQPIKPFSSIQNTGNRISKRIAGEIGVPEKKVFPVQNDHSLDSMSVGHKKMQEKDPTLPHPTSSFSAFNT